MPHRVAFFAVGTLLLAILALLPLALSGVFQDVEQSANPTFRITPSQQPSSRSFSRVNLNVTGLNEWQRKVTIEVSGHHVCEGGCSWSDHFLLVSIPVAEEDGEGLLLADTIVFPPGTTEVTKVISLPSPAMPSAIPSTTTGSSSA